MDKRIQDLDPTLVIGDDDLLHLSQSGLDRKVSFSVLKDIVEADVQGMVNQVEETLINVQDLASIVEGYKYSAELAAGSSQDSEVAAELSEANAKESELSAQDAETMSKMWASKPENEIVEDDYYSAFHYMKKSQAASTAASIASQLAIASADSAELHAGIATSMADLANSSAIIAQASAIQSEIYKDESVSARDAAEQAKDEAIAASSVSGDVVFVLTYADAGSKLPLPDGTAVEVSQDENYDGDRTRYIVASGALVFAVNLSQIKKDLANATDPEKGAGMVGFEAGQSVKDRLLRTAYVHATVFDMVGNTKLRVGDRVETLEYYTGSGGYSSNTYRIVSSGDPDGGSIIALSNGLRAAGLFPNGVNVKQFGAVGNAQYFRSSDSQWYANDSFSIPSTDDTQAINAAITYASKLGLPVYVVGRCLVNGTINLGKGRIIGLNQGQMNLRTASSALCSGHSVTSNRLSDNTWSNPLIYCDNSDDFIGGGGIENIALLGNSSNAAGFNGRAPRCAIQGYFWINGACPNVWVSGFARPALSAVGLVQDRYFDGWQVINCGVNTATEYAAMLETRPSVEGVGPFEAGRSPNSLHFSGCRFEHCAAYIDFDHGTRNVGEIDFNGCKFEVSTWERFYDSPIKIASGVGPVTFSGGTHFTVEQSETADGTRVWFMRVQNHQTKFAACTFRGSVQMLQSTGPYIDIKACHWEKAATDFFGFDVRSGDVEMSIGQRLAGINTRFGVFLGGKARADLTFYSLPGFSSNQDITAGQLVRFNKDDAPIVKIRVLQDTSSRQVYARLYGATTGLQDDSYNLRVERVDVQGRSITHPSGVSTIDLGVIGTDVIHLEDSATVSRLRAGTVGRVVRLIADGSASIAHGTYIKLTGGMGKSLAAGEAISILMISGSVAVEI